MNPYRYSHKLRGRVVNWVKKTATTDQIVRLATNFAPGYIFDESVASTQGEAGASPNQSDSVASAGRAEKWEDVIKQAYAAVAETSKGLATVDEVADHWSKASRIFELYADEARERAELHGASLSAGDKPGDFGG